MWPVFCDTAVSKAVMRPRKLANARAVGSTCPTKTMSAARESVDISGYSLEQLQMMREGMTNDIKPVIVSHPKSACAQPVACVAG